jgi:hypothetical protein
LAERKESDVVGRKVKNSSFESVAVKTGKSASSVVKPKAKPKVTIEKEPVVIEEKPKAILEEDPVVIEEKPKAKPVTSTPKLLDTPATPAVVAGTGFAGLLTASKLKDKNYWNEIKNLPGFVWILLLIVALLSSLITFQITQSVLDRSGGRLVALSAEELRDAVADTGQTIYWVGPEENAKYTLENFGEASTFIRYLPDGGGVDDTREIYLVVATYFVNNAYEAIRAAGEEQDSVGLISPDGAAIYYSKRAPNNVYMAFPNQNIQIEIFDPTPGRAIVLATTDGAIQPVK